MQDRKDGKKKGVLLTLLGGTLWGVCGSCGQFLMQYKGVTSDWLVPWRLTLAGAVILLFLFATEKGRTLDVWKESRGRRDILIFSVFGMMLCQYSYFTTIQYSNAGTATVLQYTGPAMILLFLCIKNRRRPRPYEMAALLCSMAGTFVLATHGNPTELAIPAGALFWGLAAAVTVVIYNLQPAWLMQRYSTLLTLGWGMLIGGLVLMAVRRPWRIHPLMDAETLLAMGFIVLFGTVCGFYFYLSGVKLVGAGNASMLSCVEPVAATIMSVTWLKVVFQPVDLLGFALVLSAVLIISINQAREEQAAQPQKGQTAQPQDKRTA